MIVETPQLVHMAMSKEAQPSGNGDLDFGFEAIFMAHYQRVYSLLIRLVGERGKAEELANDVFCRLHDQPASARVWENVAGWLCRTATNAGIDALRASARRRRYETEAGHFQSASSPDGNPLDSVLRTELCHQVRSVLSTMKPAQAQILLMRSSGCSYKEVAQALQITVGSVGTMLNRAEDEFRKRYIKLTGHKEAL